MKLSLYICSVDRILAIEGSKIKYTSYVGYTIRRLLSGLNSHSLKALSFYLYPVSKYC